MSSNNLPVLIIPAYNPDEALQSLLEKHQALHNDQICIIVNDGSDKSSLPIFKALEDKAYVVLHHRENLGKGAALKTAMAFYLKQYAEHTPGVITADADGQHALDDIIKVSEAFAHQPHQLYLGIRQFALSNTPWKSRIGNKVTRYFFNLLTGNQIQDTQTGLRAIPRALIPLLLETKSSGYEFEFEMFFIANEEGIELKQIPIETIYHHHNKGSHFNPWSDSLKIYSLFFRYALKSRSSQAKTR